MKFTFVIPTYNRVGELKELLPTIEDQSYPHDLYELIIVDDGSTDDTLSYLDSIEPGYHLEVISQSNQGPGAARNTGMKQARGSYIIFVDSDCLLPSDYLSKIDQRLDETPVDAFGGPDTYHPSFSPLLKAINYSMTSFLGTGGTRGGSEQAVAKYYPRSFNMGIHKRVFETIGGFGGLRHGQDMDYSARIYEAEFSVALFSDVYVYHKRRTSLRRFFKQIYNWGVARINLSQVHDGFLKAIHLAPAAIVVASLVFVMLKLMGFLHPIFWIAFVTGIVGIATLAFVQSLIMYGDLWTALLSVITLFTQVYAYGMGTISGLFQVHVLGKKVSKGFTKNYYK